MRIRSFIIAYALVLAILLFADRRPVRSDQNRYSHVVDLTAADTASSQPAATRNSARNSDSRTHIIAPDALIPGTWTASQIPPERLVAPLVVMDLQSRADDQAISLDDIAAWESHNGMIPQGAVIAVRGPSSAVATLANDSSTSQFPIARDAAEFLIDARDTVGFAVETPVDFTQDRTLARQIALHGSYVVEGATGFTALPSTGSLVLVAPAKTKKSTPASVRVLAMVR
jgi:kynurenine formamidase